MVAFIPPDTKTYFIFAFDLERLSKNSIVDEVVVCLTTPRRETRFGKKTLGSGSPLSRAITITISVKIMSVFERPLSESVTPPEHMMMLHIGISIPFTFSNHRRL